MREITHTGSRAGGAKVPQCSVFGSKLVVFLFVFFFTLRLFRLLRPDRQRQSAFSASVQAGGVRWNRKCPFGRHSSLSCDQPVTLNRARPGSCSMWRKKRSAQVRRRLDKAVKSCRRVEEHKHMHAHMQGREERRGLTSQRLFHDEIHDDGF